MKQSFTLKTSRLILPILIGIFVVSGTLLSLPFLRPINTGDIGYELSEGNPVATISTKARTEFILPIITKLIDESFVFPFEAKFQAMLKQSFLTKNIFRNVLFARAP